MTTENHAEKESARIDHLYRKLGKLQDEHDRLNAKFEEAMGLVSRALGYIAKGGK